MHLGSIELGSCRVDAIDGGAAWMDGGAIFGVVPKPLWSKLTPADDQNRVRLPFFSLLVRTDEATIVIEAGSTAHQPPKVQEAMLSHGSNLVETLSSLGVAPEDVDFFIPSHLHFDHVGAASTPDGKGITFPNAWYVFQKREWEEANHPIPVNVNAYLPGDIAPLHAAKLRIIEGNVEVTPGVEVTLSPSHSVGQQMIRVGRGKDSVLFTGDTVPTSEHLSLRWMCAFDVYPIETYNAKLALLTQAARDGSYIAPGHGGNAPICSVISTAPGRFTPQLAPGISAPPVG